MIDNHPLYVHLAPFTHEYLQAIWQHGFQEDQPEWKEWDGPYFKDDYQKYDTFEAFLKAPIAQLFRSDQSRCILLNGQPVGMVSRYWEDRQTLWLNIGITIYNPKYWCHGIGTRALMQWIDIIFDTFLDLEHVGLTTWSGNQRMMKAAEKLRMTKEAQIRKVRFWQGTYFDSVSYGVLREEWKNKI